MCFYPARQIVPVETRTSEFILQPLMPEHVEIDYEAVMASKEMLRLWSGTTWPREDFPLAQNLLDLQWHHQEHQDREAFTYTVLDPAAKVCLGCVYIRPLTDLVAANPEILQDIGQDEAIVRFWVRTSAIDGGLDRRLLQHLLGWTGESWAFPRIFFHTRMANQQQIALFEEIGLTKQMELQYAQRGGVHYFYCAGSNL